jgi:hypothetical protein
MWLNPYRYADPNEQSTFFKEDTELIEQYNEFENSSTTVNQPDSGFVSGSGLGLTAGATPASALNPSGLFVWRSTRAFFSTRTSRWTTSISPYPRVRTGRYKLRVQRLQHGQPHIQAAVELERVQQEAAQ